MEVIHPQTTFYWTPSKVKAKALVVMKGESRQVFTCLDSSIKSELSDIIKTGTVDKSKTLGCWLQKNSFTTYIQNKIPPNLNKWNRQLSYYCTFTSLENAVYFQKHLLKIRVLIIGVGGIGCNLIQQLCNIGVQSFILIDGDTIEESNLNRQVLFSQSDIGKTKVDVAKKWILTKNKKAKVKIFNQKYEKLSLSLNEKKQIDLVIVSADNNTLVIRETVAQDFYPIKTPYAFLSYNGNHGKIGPLIFNFQNGCGCCVTNLIDLSCSLEEISNPNSFGIPPSSSSTNSLVVSIFLNEYVKSFFSQTKDLLITYNIISNNIDIKEIKRYDSCKRCGQSTL